MKNTNIIATDYELLAKYFAREASHDEILHIETWASQHADHKKEFDRLYFLWIQAEKPKLEAQIDTDKAWSNFENRIKRDSQTVQSRIKPKNLYIKRIVQIAAVLILVVAVRILIPMFSSETSVLQVVATSETKFLNLSDSSDVSLYPNSELSYSTEFSSDERRVELRGKAFFKVQRTDGQKFIVGTEHAEVTVLGTEFEVQAVPKSDTVKVLVVSGKVALSSKSDSAKIILTRGDVGILNTRTGALSKTSDNDVNQYFSETKTLIFENTTLSEVVNTLSKAYKIELKIEDEALKNCRWTVSFKDSELSEVLDLLRNTFSIKIEQHNNSYSMYGEGC